MLVRKHFFFPKQVALPRRQLSLSYLLHNSGSDRDECMPLSRILVQNETLTTSFMHIASCMLCHAHYFMWVASRVQPHICCIKHFFFDMYPQCVLPAQWINQNINLINSAVGWGFTTHQLHLSRGIRTLSLMSVRDITLKNLTVRF